ncbi:spermidine N(1)-acetyltransferase [Oxobacter pfennigii]|uniref:Spermidine N(1)-acetyltransferase n=1 Tax=Oxobacter pfennigii TaxID=36849 RepID=A0A0N8NSR3_9CLOT|nr:GNAT family N-acetyltransferase [Oxobacter pfennigii]KPU42752.1 spermidine N(1)-acetyltransferase [Oxobacter pfennigii]
MDRNFKINIRPVRIEDELFINEMRTMDGVRENILALFTERVTSTRSFLENLSQNEHSLVAEIDEGQNKKVVGMIGLHVNGSPRMRHSAGIGIMVHTNYQGKGIGKALFEKVIGLADNWLMLNRLELSVFTDNEKAINLYKKFGFEIEGCKKCAIIRNGKYEDEYIMARLRF